MGDHSAKGEEYPPGTMFGPNGEPAGPLSDTSMPDIDGVVDQEPHYEEAEDLQPDLSKWDPDVVSAQ